VKSQIQTTEILEMVSERLKTLFGKVKERLSELKPEDVAKFAAKEAVGAIPVVGQIIKDAFDEFSEDEKGELIKELKELSESQFKEISEKVGVSVEYLQDIQKFTLYTFKELRADHEEIKELLLRLIEIQIGGEINIPTIQSVLRKEETTKGDFFKKEPEWIDFEEGFVVERKEVDEIINKLENDPIQLVLGEPASGKSVILKNIGIKLANANKDVYVVELKKHSRDEVKRYFDDIPEIKDEKAVFIVDDAHLLFAECERLVREFKNMRLKAKLIIGSRPTREISGEHPKEASEFEYVSKIDIRAEDVTEGMIKTFLKRKYDFSDGRIKEVSKNLEKYKKDLWHLSWALKAFNPEKDSIDEKEIDKKVKNSIEDINAENIFLPLSVFYRFEIHIERNFLEEKLGIEENKINQLIELSEITQTEEAGRHRMLSLNHSSIAELYFKTYHEYPDLGRKIKNGILNGRDKDLLQYRLFYKYMTCTDPKNTVDIVFRLGGEELDKKGEKTLLKKLIEDDKIQELTVEGIDQEEDTRKIGWCFLFIAKIKPKVAQKIAKRVEFNTLSTKLERGTDASGNAICVAGFAKVNKVKSLKLVNIVSSKIEKEWDVEYIGWCAWSFAEADKELARQITDRINIETILTKIEKEADIRKIWWCIQGISKANRRVEREIDNRLNPKLREELQKEGG